MGERVKRGEVKQRGVLDSGKNKKVLKKGLFQKEEKMKKILKI